jgi:hypothetical protein
MSTSSTDSQAKIDELSEFLATLISVSECFWQLLLGSGNEEGLWSSLPAAALAPIALNLRSIALDLVDLLAWLADHVDHADRLHALVLEVMRRVCGWALEEREVRHAFLRVLPTLLRLDHSPVIATPVTSVLQFIFPFLRLLVEYQRRERHGEDDTNDDDDDDDDRLVEDLVGMRGLVSAILNTIVVAADETFARSTSEQVEPHSDQTVVQVDQVAVAAGLLKELLHDRRVELTALARKEGFDAFTSLCSQNIPRDLIWRFIEALRLIADCKGVDDSRDLMSSVSSLQKTLNVQGLRLT